MDYQDSGCDNCGCQPARMVLPNTERRLCGVCAHRLAIAKDLAERVLQYRRRNAA